MHLRTLPCLDLAACPEAMCAADGMGLQELRPSRRRERGYRAAVNDPVGTLQRRAARLPHLPGMPPGAARGRSASTCCTPHGSRASCSRDLACWSDRRSARHAAPGEAWPHPPRSTAPTQATRTHAAHHTALLAAWSAGSAPCRREHQEGARLPATLREDLVRSPQALPCRRAAHRACHAERTCACSGSTHLHNRRWALMQERPRLGMRRTRPAAVASALPWGRSLVREQRGMAWKCMRQGQPLCAGLLRAGLLVQPTAQRLSWAGPGAGSPVWG